MRILALEGYYGGSHRAFLDGWIERSRHQWDVLTLPPNKWKWRMRHGAFTLAERADALAAGGARWDALFCSDMLNVAEFRGLACTAVRRLPTVVYFHENQLTYPVRFEDERDYQYVLTNFTSALTAEAVWFNSAFHRDAFLGALKGFFERMPDFPPHAQIASLHSKCFVHAPGIEPLPQRQQQRTPGPLRILWAARWEHDKNPDDFFAAIEQLADKGLPFRLSVIGEQFRESPPVFAQAKKQFADRIDRWGFQPSRQDYVNALAEADVVVSTADHEFFGISVAEAVAAGAGPLLPRRLAYPEIIRQIAGDNDEGCFYDGTVNDLARQLERFIDRLNQNALPQDDTLARNADALFGWPRRAAEMDDAMENLCRK